ncbi:MAG TPA: TetR family transcriptional regulator [Nocardioides sp.]|nr:TetR family transcriptional regulator [Nocardioides sp.]
MGTTETTRTTDTARRRGYRSELRAQQAAATRRTVIEAARALFVANGWAGTGVRDVAAAAGVAVETVYAHFSSKKGLLRAVADQAVVGDEEPVPLAARAEFAALGRGPRADRLAATAALITAIHVRTVAMFKVLDEAAPAEPEMAEFLAAARERRRQDVARGTELVIGRKPLRAEVDGVWALASPEVYLLLVEESGWTPGEYQQWIEHLLERAVPRS